jgi:hypothetical protein
MKIIVNGVVTEISEEDVKRIEDALSNRKITDKDRISALENAIADLAVMLMEVE